MNIPVERWFKSIVVRHSRRKYVNKEIEVDTLDKIQASLEELNSHFEGARLVLMNGECDYVFKGIIGAYGKISGAQAYVAMIGHTEVERIPEKIGYIGEGFILEATALGLGTCWVAGTFKSKKVESDIELKDNERIYAISPLGYVEEKYSLSEKMMKKMVSSHMRKDLDELCGGKFNEKWPKWIKTALRCARLAPSAINAQPWRFEVNDNSLTLSVDNPKNSTKDLKRIDCGIAMMHLELGALLEGAKGSWQYLQEPSIAKYKID